MPNEATGHVKIIKIPAGEAPLKIRAAWVGRTLRCYPHIGTCGETTGVLTGEKTADERRGVSVPQILAIEELERHNPSFYVLDWWRQHGFPQPGQNFFFGVDEIEIQSGVTEAPMRVFDDMETGHWEEMPLGAGGR